MGDVRNLFETSAQRGSSLQRFVEAKDVENAAAIALQESGVSGFAYLNIKGLMGEVAGFSDEDFEFLLAIIEELEVGNQPQCFHLARYAVEAGRLNMALRIFDYFNANVPELKVERRVFDFYKGLIEVAAKVGDIELLAKISKNIERSEGSKVSFLRLYLMGYQALPEEATEPTRERALAVVR